MSFGVEAEVLTATGGIMKKGETRTLFMPKT